MPRRRAPRAPERPERLQSGVRLERTLLKVLKAVAEYMDLSLSELLELVVVQSFEGAAGFSKGTLRRIEQLKQIYGMSYGVDEVRARLFTDRHG